MAPEEDRRRDKRVYKRFVLRVAASDVHPPSWSHVTIRNLSVSGMLFTYDRQVTEGDLLRLKIDFPERVVECRGRVMRVEGPKSGRFPDVGVRFENMSDADRAYVMEYVEGLWERRGQ